MVERQLRGRGIRDEAVLAAMAAVPREVFVPPDLLNHAYSDDALPIEVGQAISQPYMVAQMTELLAPREGIQGPGVGAGSGTRPPCWQRSAAGSSASSATPSWRGPPWPGWRS